MNEILLLDLCARLPYGIWFQSYHSEGGIEGKGTSNFYIDIKTDNAAARLSFLCKYNNNKPYLRSMSSMTQEEKNKYEEISHNSFDGTWFSTSEPFDYLNSIYVDYRGLIKKGLAIEAPNEMYTI